MEYAEYLASDQWYQRAKEAKQRAGWKCEVCCAKSPVEAHHKTYRRLGFERNSDLIVLCRRCHGLFHGIIESSRQRSLPYEEMQKFTFRFPRCEELN